MADYRAGVWKVQDESGTQSCAKSKEVLKMMGTGEEGDGGGEE